MPTTITSAGVTFTDTTTLTSANGVPSALKLTTARTINGVSFDGTADITIPGSSIVAINAAKAWVNFDGASSGTWAGGTSTVQRLTGSSTANVITSNPHGLITGNNVYVATGLVASGGYSVTVTSTTRFSITTVATTLIVQSPITFNVSTIRSSYNVSSVTKNATSVYTVNFASALADANYAITGSLSVLNQSTGSTSDTNASVYNGSFAVSNDTVPTTTSCRVVASGGYYSGNGYENPRICVAIFGN